MDQTERQIIDDLFAKLHQAEAQSGPRDPEAEALIRERIARQPAAAYLMAQAIVMMEQALAASQGRNEELERQLRERPAAAAPAQSGGGGLFGSLFGGGSRPAPQPAYPAAPPSAAAPAAAMPAGSPWGRPPAAANAPAYGDPRVAAYAQQPRAGGGFMAGAMQTAAGVAGGMLIGSALSSMFSGGEAMASEAATAATDAATAATDHAEQAVEGSGWGDFGSDFGGEEEL
ncbi:hypothetical protein J2848_005821 [Azospirillum lipoferum]|uniref:DUF2076 domain-containing protein n=2 Tax=Azospirillum lipoferum TaxID=193 RepID=A0A5A9GH41_AZOLI|nr:MULTISPECIES: DUF2076 domain-containing protein [Azospirillum]KAA0593818.1 DUF2076 domain-containing protein [Azospirillum lipoferum]MCP1614118.1 hypothetical protein [Azospirillum lipoferum]MDW5536805.1 DUF2076 domain-containing protein [Azospirillum sp. NL1]